MRQFLVFQSLWAMQTEPGPLEAQLDRIKAAGFDGITDHYWQPTDVARLHAAASARGLQIEGQLFPQSVDDLAAALDVISRYGCHHLTLQADVRPRTQADAARLVEGWQRLAEQVVEVATAEDEAVAVHASLDAKCERCWHYRADTGSHADHPGLCARCYSNLFGAGEVRRFA